MLDQHDAHSDRNDVSRNIDPRDTASDRSSAERPLADREVPLPSVNAEGSVSSLAVNEWLDGDMSETDARRLDAKQVDMWSRIASETAMRKQVTTPAYVAANIMAALPESRFERRKRMDRRKMARMETSAATTTSGAVDTERGLSMNMAVAIGVGLFAVGLAIGKML